MHSNAQTKCKLIPMFTTRFDYLHIILSFTYSPRFITFIPLNFNNTHFEKGELWRKDYMPERPNEYTDKTIFVCHLTVINICFLYLHTLSHFLYESTFQLGGTTV